MKRARAGFTLVEMMVVIGIIAVVATVTIVAFTPFFRGKSLDSAAMRVKTALLSARTYAVNYRCDVQLMRVYDAALDTYYLRVFDVAGTTPRGERVLMPKTVNRIEIRDPGGTAVNALTVSPMGQLSSTGTYEVVVSGPRGSKTLWVFWASCQAYSE
jgi:prepilin-type N-terminal cleavage/methylation domain-containing protein